MIFNTLFLPFLVEAKSFSEVRDGKEKQYYFYSGTGFGLATYLCLFVDSGHMSLKESKSIRDSILDAWEKDFEYSDRKQNTFEAIKEGYKDGLADIQSENKGKGCDGLEID